ncbi:hypothetical protein LTR66_001209 [Elasticomyces elasticus]|nr:hypothetical protein LTR66_001209 [Elasticomyces elasticus]
MSSNKVQVNGTSSTSFANSSTRAALTSALLANGSIPRIQSALLYELQSSGWTANLKLYIENLIRSGECTRCEDIMSKVLEAAMPEEMKAAEGANGPEEEKIKMPEKAVREGIKVVRKELEVVCEVTGR